MNLRKKVIGGAFWTAGRSIIKFPLTMGVSIALARLLEPEDFGLIAFIGVFQGMLMLLATFGLEPAIIFHQDASEEETSSLFWFSIATGTLASAVLLLAIPIMAANFADPRLATVVPWLALSVFFHVAMVVPYALVKKAMRYQAEGIIDMGVTTLSGVLAVSAAYLGYGVWSLVGQWLFSSFAVFALVFLASGFRPRFAFGRKALMPSLRFGMNVLGSSVLGHVAHNLDRLIVGKLVGADGLGLYARAFGLPQLVPQLFQSFASSIWLPALAQLNGDPERMKSAVLRGFGIACAGFIPLLVGLCVLSRHFILVLYGSKWIAAAPILTLIAMAYLLKMLTLPFTVLFEACGRPELQLRWAMASTVLYVSSVALGGMGGTAVTVAAGYLAASALLFLPRCLIAGGLVGIGFGDLIRQLAGPAAVGCLMAATLLFALPTLGQVGSALELVILVALGAAVYAGASLLLKPPGVVELMALAQRRGGSA